MTAKPTTHKYCVFCQYWIGDAELELKDKNIGFHFKETVHGRCAKENLQKSAGFNACFCKYFAPNEKAKILL